MEGSRQEPPKPNAFTRMFEKLRERLQSVGISRLKSQSPASGTDSVVPITQNLTDAEVIERSWQIEQIEPHYQGTNITKMPRSRYGMNEPPPPPKKGA